MELKRPLSRTHRAARAVVRARLGLLDLAGRVGATRHYFFVHDRTNWAQQLVDDRCFDWRIRRVIHSWLNFGRCNHGFVRDVQRQ